MRTSKTLRTEKILILALAALIAIIISSNTAFAAITYYNTSSGNNISIGNPLFIDNTNSRVGILKTNPTTALDVTGTITATDITCTNCLGAGDIGDGLGTAEIDETVMQQRVSGTCSGNTALQSVAQGGTVGCSSTFLTSETDATLTNDGAVTIGSGSANPTTLTFNSDAGTDGTIAWDGTNDQFEIVSGTLGIGTNNPGKKLEIYEDNSATTTTTGILVTNPSTTANSRAGIVFKNYDNNGAAIWSPRTGSASGYLIFGTNSGAGIAETNIVEGMRLDNSGRLGIGSTSPSSKLHVTGNISVYNSQSGSESVAIDFYPAYSGGVPSYGIGMGPTASEGYITYRSGTASTTAFGHKFYVNNAEMMRIRGDGSVGIGTSSPLGNAADLTLGSAAGTQGILYLYGSTAGAYSSIQTTNGNLHIDAYSTSGTYLNYYGGTGGVIFGNGASGSSGASVSSAGVVTATSFSGAGTSLTGTAASLNIGGNSGTTTRLTTSDTRATNPAPQTYSHGITSDFKSNGVDGLTDGGSFHGVLTFRQWSDWSGGGIKQIGFTDNHVLYLRGAVADNAWSSWYKIWSENNDGSGSTLDADTLDGISSGSFLRSDIDSGFTGLNFGYSSGAPLDVGNTAVDYQANSGWAGTWNSNILLSGTDYSTISWHDSGVSVGALGYHNNMFFFDGAGSWGPVKLGINQRSPSYSLDVAGDLRTTGNVIITGDYNSGYSVGDANWGLRVYNSGSNYYTDATYSSSGSDNARGFRVFDMADSSVDFFVSQSGAVGIGTGTPPTNYPLSIYKSSNSDKAQILFNKSGIVWDIGMSSNEGNFWIGDGVVAVHLSINRSTGYVGVGDITPNYDLDVWGTICQDTNSDETCDGTVTSDERLKTNITIIRDSIQKIQALNGVYFYWNESINATEFLGRGHRQVGMIAQDVEKQFPELIYEDMQGYKMIDYQKITGITINAIKEQQVEINETQESVEVLSREIASIKSENERLKAYNEELERRISQIESKLQE